MKKYTMIAMMGFVMLSLTASAQKGDGSYSYGTNWKNNVVQAQKPYRYSHVYDDKTVTKIGGYECRCVDGSKVPKFFATCEDKEIFFVKYTYTKEHGKREVVDVDLEGTNLPCETPKFQAYETR